MRYRTSKQTTFTRASRPYLRADSRPDRRSSRCPLVLAALMAVEVVGMALLWTLVPLGWIWVGREIGAATYSALAGMAGAFLGFVASAIVIALALERIDVAWIDLRRQVGHRQPEGALVRKWRSPERSVCSLSMSGTTCSPTPSCCPSCRPHELRTVAADG